MSGRSMSSLKLHDTLLDNIDIVIFDKDGTLIDIHHYWCSMIKFRAEFFLQEFQLPEEKKQLLYNALVSNMGIDQKSNKMKPEGPVGIKPRSFIIDVAFETIKNHGLSFTREQVSDLFERVDSYSNDKLSDIVQLLEGVSELLASLKQEGMILAIATTDLSGRARLAMQSLGIEHYFDTIAGADLVKNAKPSADLVNYILSKHKLAPEKAVVIGDALADLEMAKNANTRFIAVKTGLFTETFLKTSDNVIETLHEIKVAK